MRKTLFCICLINKSTGSIDHIAVSDLPLADNIVGTSEPSSDYTLKRFKFKANLSGNSILRAREVLAEITVIRGNIANKPGRTKLTNIE